MAMVEEHGILLRDRIELPTRWWFDSLRLTIKNDVHMRYRASINYLLVNAPHTSDRYGRFRADRDAHDRNG